MAKTIIVGAGPIGLLVGIILHLKGIKELEIIDPRAGTYLRPGHINLPIFKAVENLIHLHLPPAQKDEFIMKPSDSGHIKEMERMLYEKAKCLGITITKHEFIRLAKENATKRSQKGIIVKAADTDKLKRLPAEHVFDCTGGKRAVCKSYNSLVSESVFIEEKICPNVIIKNHLIYNLKVDCGYMYKIECNLGDIFTSLNNGTVAQMEKLRALGWTRALFPSMYKKKFTQSYGVIKYCFYLEAPDGLQSSKYDDWFKACLDIYLEGEKIEISELACSKKYGQIKEQLRKSAYLSEPTYVTRYEGIAPTDTLSGVYPIGDAQATPDPRLAIGVRNGNERVGALANHLNVNKHGELVSIDIACYRADISKNIDRHNNKIRDLQQLQRINQEESEVKNLIRNYESHLKTLSPDIGSAQKDKIAEAIELFKAIDKYYSLLKTGKNSSTEGPFSYPFTMTHAEEIMQSASKSTSLQNTTSFCDALETTFNSLPENFAYERSVIKKLAEKKQSFQRKQNSPLFFQSKDNENSNSKKKLIKKRKLR